MSYTLLKFIENVNVEQSPNLIGEFQFFGYKSEISI